jgi:hypothetical protein
MKTQAIPTLRTVVIPAGHILTQNELDALRDPERLISSRHCKRNANGQLVARREFTIAIRGGE